MLSARYLPLFIGFIFTFVGSFLGLAHNPPKSTMKKLLIPVGVVFSLTLSIVLLPLFTIWLRCEPPPVFEIMDAKLKMIETSEGKQFYSLSIEIWNSGIIDIMGLKVDCKEIGLNNRELLKPGEVLAEGEKKNFVVTEGLSFKVGETYTVVIKAEAHARVSFGALQKSERTIIVTAIRA